MSSPIRDEGSPWSKYEISGKRRGGRLAVGQLSLTVSPGESDLSDPLRGVQLRDQWVAFQDLRSWLLLLTRFVLTSAGCPIG